MGGWTGAHPAALWEFTMDVLTTGPAVADLHSARRVAALEASHARLSEDRAELRTQLAALKKQVDLLERRVNGSKMPL